MLLPSLTSTTQSYPPISSTGNLDRKGYLSKPFVQVIACELLIPGVGSILSVMLIGTAYQWDYSHVILFNFFFTQHNYNNKCTFFNYVKSTIDTVMHSTVDVHTVYSLFTIYIQRHPNYPAQTASLMHILSGFNFQSAVSVVSLISSICARAGVEFSLFLTNGKTVEINEATVKGAVAVKVLKRKLGTEMTGDNREEEEKLRVHEIIKRLSHALTKI